MPDPWPAGTLSLRRRTPGGTRRRGGRTDRRRYSRHAPVGGPPGRLSTGPPAARAGESSRRPALNARAGGLEAAGAGPRARRARVTSGTALLSDADEVL